MSIPLKQQRQQLRQIVRQRRQQLTAEQQAQAGVALCQQIAQLPELPQAQKIAIFLSFDAELNTQPTIDYLWQQQKQVLLPRLHPFTRRGLLFLNYRPTSKMVRNAFGLLEPVLDVRQVCPIEQIDIMFTPLVAFDQHNNRLGMGGGYYDRLLPFVHAPKIGLAHRCQYVEQLPIAPWDVPLDRVIAV